MKGEAYPKPGSGEKMIYVMQVRTGTETETEQMVRLLLEPTLYQDVYFPIRVMKRKQQGEWQEVKEKLLPGYVFIEAEDSESLYIGLKKVPRLTKLLGYTQDGISVLDERDASWLNRIMRERDGQYQEDAALRHEVGLTLVSVEETAEGRKIKILEGPLKEVEGMILRYDLHRRRAEVEVEFMGQRTVLHMGIVIQGEEK